MPVRQSTPVVGSRWAVLVGVSTYADERLSLQYAARDATKLAELIRTPHGGGSPALVACPSGARADAVSFADTLTGLGLVAAEDVVVLLDAEATRQRILTEFASLAAHAATDLAVFHFAGVGSWTLDGRPTLLSVDARAVAGSGPRPARPRPARRRPRRGVRGCAQPRRRHRRRQLRRLRTPSHRRGGPSARISRGDACWGRPCPHHPDVAGGRGARSRHPRAGRPQGDQGPCRRAGDPLRSSPGPPDRRYRAGARAGTLVAASPRADDLCPAREPKWATGESGGERGRVDRAGPAAPHRPGHRGRRSARAGARPRPRLPEAGLRSDRRRRLAQRAGPRAHLEAGLALDALGEHDRALRYLRAARNLSDHSPGSIEPATMDVQVSEWHRWASHHLGRILYEQGGDLNEAVAALRAAYDGGRHEPRTSYHLALAIKTLVEQESLRDVEAHLRRYLDLGAPLGHEERVRDILRSLPTR